MGLLINLVCMFRTKLLSFAGEAKFVFFCFLSKMLVVVVVLAVRESFHT